MSTTDDLTPELEAAGRAIAERMYKGQRTLDGKPMAWDVLDAPGRRAVLVFARAALEAAAPAIAAEALRAAADDFATTLSGRRDVQGVLRSRADRIEHDARCPHPKCPGGGLCCCLSEQGGQP